MQHEAEINQIRDQVGPWPEEDRLALAHQLLDDLRSTVSHPQSHATLSDATGVVAGNGAPPDDETVKQWLAERRLRKFG